MNIADKQAMKIRDINAMGLGDYPEISDEELAADLVKHPWKSPEHPATKARIESGRLAISKRVANEPEKPKDDPANQALSEENDHAHDDAYAALDRMKWMVANMPITIGRHGLDIMVVTEDDKVAFAASLALAIDDLIERYPL